MDKLVSFLHISLLLAKHIVPATLLTQAHCFSLNKCLAIKLLFFFSIKVFFVFPAENKYRTCPKYTLYFIFFKMFVDFFFYFFF